MRICLGLALLCAACAAPAPGAAVATAGWGAPAWVTRPDLARSAAVPLECFATGLAPLGPALDGDGQAYARAAEQARRDALQRLGRRAEELLGTIGLSAGRTAIVEALQAAARVRGRYVDATDYHVWLGSDLDAALEASSARVSDEQREMLARALGGSAGANGAR